MEKYADHDDEVTTGATIRAVARMQKQKPGYILSKRLTMNWMMSPPWLRERAKRKPLMIKNKQTPVVPVNGIQWSLGNPGLSLPCDSRTNAIEKALS